LIHLSPLERKSLVPTQEKQKEYVRTPGVCGALARMLTPTVAGRRQNAPALSAAILRPLQSSCSIVK
jgi:hypothetical protein